MLFFKEGWFFGSIFSYRRTVSTFHNVINLKIIFIGEEAEELTAAERSLIQKVIRLVDWYLNFIGLIDQNWAFKFLWYRTSVHHLLIRVVDPDRIRIDLALLDPDLHSQYRPKLTIKTVHIPAFQKGIRTNVGVFYDLLYYPQKVYFSFKNSTFCNDKVWLGSGSAWISIEVKSWIRIPI